MQKTISEAQLKANRENSLHSTGPTSTKGKRIVRMNAVVHGFAGHTVVLHEHEIPAYNQHFASFRKEYSPVGATEEFLVQSLAELSWSAQQIRSQITTAIAVAGNTQLDYQAGSEPPDCVLSQAGSIKASAPSLNTLGIYEQRKMRLFYATRKELVQIQTERKTREKAGLEEAAQLRKAHKAARQPGEPEWQPAENGFVCSLQEIDRYIARQDLLSRLNKPLKTAA